MSSKKSQVTLIPSRRSGVYQILCKPTGKIYIGSAVDLQARWEHHRRALRRDVHCNAHLQKAWDKYGEENFEFSTLEFVDTANLLSAEQKWINTTQCADRKIGFNIYDVAGSPGTKHVRVWEGFNDPDGNEVTIMNLYGFCRQGRLDFPSMHRLAKGRSKLKSYKGWTHKNSPRQRDYVKTYDGFIAPGGYLVGLITNLAAFCRKHGLEKSHMVTVAHGRICSHRGWTHRNGRKNNRKIGIPKTYTNFINPDGELEIITNLRAFCRERGLCSVHMYELISGKRKSHKGWIWRRNYG